jgi:hypothetical protein
VQSTALLVLAAQEKIDFKTFLFCNVGDDSEHPATLQYVRNVAIPYAKEHNIDLVELHRVKRTGDPETLYQRLTRDGIRSIDIPVRMNNGAPGNRNCTADFKIKVVDRWLRERGAKESGAQVAIGISLDEFQRMKPNMDKATPWKENRFPLIDLRMSRQDCISVIQKAGLPVPPKSSCFFCPFKSISNWQSMRNDEPELFRKSVDLENTMNDRRAMLGKDKVWFSNKLKPLDKATTELEQQSLFSEDIGCDSGYCWT